MDACLTQVFLLFCDKTLWGGSSGRLLHEGQQWRRRGAADDVHRAAHARCLPMLGVIAPDMHSVSRWAACDT